MKLAFRIAIALATALAGAASAVAQSPYRLESAVALKGHSPEWDYVTLDPARGRLFIGRRNDGAMVYDIKARRVIRTLDQTDDANAIVLVPEFDRGYTTNGDGSTTAFQISTLKTIGRIKFGDDADAGFYDPITHQIAYTMGDSKAIAFIDAGTGRITGKLPMESHKLDAAVADGHGGLFMALRDRDAIARIDMANRQQVGEWKTTGCDEPTGLAYDAANRRLFVGCRGKAPVLAVLDAETGAVITTLEIGRGNDGVIYDAGSRRVYTSNGVDANLVIYDQVDADHYKLASAVTTRPYARTMALDAGTRKIYLVTAEGLADPSRKINKAVAPFYPNRYFDDTFTVLTYAQR
ncbi:MAG: YncE family protein [Pseudomonadota bacterium]|nr:YncE family protein [Pseudomonadota bacterium]